MWAGLKILLFARGELRAKANNMCVGERERENDALSTFPKAPLIMENPNLNIHATQ